MPSHPSLHIRAAQLLGITTSAIYSGAVFYQYLFALPSYVALPAKPATAKWYRMHILSKINLAPVALLGIFSFGFVASRHHSTSAASVLIGNVRLAKWKAYGLAAVLLASFVPWTAKVMLPINCVLEDYHVGKRQLGDEEVKALLGEWRRKSVIRGWPAVAAALVGAFATFA